MSVDVRAPEAGTLAECFVKVGETVMVGAALARLVTGAGGPAAAAPSAAAAAAPLAVAAPAPAAVVVAAAAAAAVDHGRTPLIKFRHGVRDDGAAAHGVHVPAPAAAPAPKPAGSSSSSGAAAGSGGGAAAAAAGRPGPRPADYRNYNAYLDARFGPSRGAVPEAEAPWAHRTRLSAEEMAAIESGGAL